MICAAKLPTGKPCTRKAKENSNVCGYHRNKVIQSRETPVLVYHNHLPGIVSTICDACQLKLNQK